MEQCGKMHTPSENGKAQQILGVESGCRALVLEGMGHTGSHERIAFLKSIRVGG